MKTIFGLFIVIASILMIIAGFDNHGRNRFKD